MRSHLVGIAVSVLALSLTACPKDKTSSEDLSQTEARESVDESSASAQAEDLTTASVEISTNFTIGGAVEKAAQQLQSFIATELPCANVTLSAATLTVVYGANPGNCVWHGHTFSGTTSVTVSKNDAGEVVVKHTWTDFSNGKVKVNGDATVTWNLENPSRHVVHSLTWTRIADGLTGTGTGDRTQAPLAGGITEGFKVDGSRTWTGPSGRWDLSIQGVEMRWADPCPQAGTYVLATPSNKSVSLSFARVDGDTIKVTVASGGKSFSFDVNEIGVNAS
jgi:hypothetical protein